MDIPVGVDIPDSYSPHFSRVINATVVVNEADLNREGARGVDAPVVVDPTKLAPEFIPQLFQFRRHPEHDPALPALLGLLVSEGTDGCSEDPLVVSADCPPTNLISSSLSAPKLPLNAPSIAW